MLGSFTIPDLGSQPVTKWRSALVNRTLTFDHVVIMARAYRVVTCSNIIIDTCKLFPSTSWWLSICFTPADMRQLKLPLTLISSIIIIIGYAGDIYLSWNIYDNVPRWSPNLGVSNVNQTQYFFHDENKKPFGAGINWSVNEGFWFVKTCNCQYLLQIQRHGRTEMSILINQHPWMTVSNFKISYFQPHGALIKKLLRRSRGHIIIT